MKMTIIAEDKAVAIDGLAFSNLTFPLADNIHAVQWNEVAGWIEYKIDAQGLKPANEIIDDVTPFQPAIDAWNVARQGYTPPNNDPQPEPTPKELCKYMAQGLLYDTDWAVLPDVSDVLQTPHLLNVQEFMNYRNTVREYVVNPVDSPVFPPVPVAVWSN